MPGTRQTVGGPAAYRLEPGESDTVLEGQSVCVTIQAGKGGELLIAGSRFPAGRTRAVCLNAPVVLQCDAAGKACRGFWRADR